MVGQAKVHLLFSALVYLPLVPSRNKVQKGLRLQHTGRGGAGLDQKELSEKATRTELGVKNKEGEHNIIT